MKIEHIIFDQQTAGSSWHVDLGPTRHHILLLVVKGKVHYTISDRTLSISKGEGLFLTQGTWRAAKADVSELHQMYSAHFRDLPLDKLTGFNSEPYLLYRPIGFDYIKQRFSVLNESWIGKMPYYDMISEGILTEILGLVQRELTNGALSSSRRSLALRIQQYIVQHYREPLRIHDLARYVDRSPNYVSNVFKEVTGRTPVEYMHEIRVAAARELLLTTNMTIGQISDSLGYCDQTYFNYMYKKIIGHPPSHSLKLGKM
ncbi:Bifunctional transcriptional activator/DNA repair enzyme AdaA [compost metagenome]